MYSVNNVLTAAPDNTAPFDGVVRIVAVSDDGTEVALMRLDLSTLRAPFKLPAVDIADGLRRNEIVMLDVFDASLASSEDQLSSTAQKALTKSVDLMRPLMGDNRLIFDAKYRAKAFEHRANEGKVSIRTIRRHFYNYLWGGMTKLALAGPQKRQGAEPVPQRIGTGRRGPKTDRIQVKSDVTLPEVRQYLEKGARLFYLPGKHTQVEAYVKTEKKFFSTGKEVIRNSPERISLRDSLAPTRTLPTYRQFRYVCELLERAEGKRASKPRQPRNVKEKEAQRGRARHGVAGPGYRYEIDATKVQIQLVSRYGRRWLVSEATLYIIIDVWSGAYVGYALSLNNASWALASKALRNCFTDKGKVFERLGLAYSSDEWVSCHLPSRLAADRAELVSNKAGVVPEIGIKVEIMPSMRPERKGKVESAIYAVKHGHNFYHVEGRHRKSPGRREPDGKNQASLTLAELEIYIVEIIMDLNNDPVPIDHIPAEALKGGYTTITHGGLFEWGLEHRAGFTRSLPNNDVFVYLMAKATASVTARGISFKEQNFVSERLLELGYTARAANKGAFDIEIRYDDDFADQIWFYDEQSPGWVPALNDDEDVRRLKAGFFELEEYRSTAKKLAFEAKTENIHRKSQKSKRLNDMTKNASEEAKRARKAMPKSGIKTQIRANKSLEQEAENVIGAEAELQSYVSAIAATRQEHATRSASPLPSSTTADTRQSVGARSLDLWRKQNAKLDQ